MKKPRTSEELEKWYASHQCFLKQMRKESLWFRFWWLWYGIKLKIWGKV